MTAMRTISVQTYEAAWELWRDGLRSRNALAEKLGMTWETAARMVDNGYPQRGWAPLMDRARLWDKQVMEQSARLAAERMREAVDEQFKARKHNLALAGRMKAALASLAAQTLDAARACKFSHTKKVIKDGREVEVEIPASAQQVAKAAKELAGAIRDLGQFEAYWLGTGDKDDLPQTSSLDGLEEDQLKFIIESGGQLPPGVTDAMLKGQAG